MSHALITSNDLIDDLIRSRFGVEPDLMAALAHGDEHVRLRRLPSTSPTTDPLDGLEVLVRRILVAALAMRDQDGPVSLMTARQAEAAGWPSAHLANLAVVLAWGLGLTESHDTLPLLVEAEDENEGAASLLGGAGDPLPPFGDLIAALRRGPSRRPLPVEQPTSVGRGAPPLRSRTLVSLGATLHAWIGVDVGSVELPSDRDGWGPALTSVNARAAGLVAWMIAEAVQAVEVMANEGVKAVRLKSEGDARLAGGPGAIAANVALILAAAIHHGAGTTVHVLPSTDEVALALVEAGRHSAIRRGQTPDDLERQTVDVLEIADLASRGYIHVGRRAAKQVALRVVDGRIGDIASWTPPSGGEATR